MKAGIVGLPNVGKSTLFNALTSSKAAQSANYPFCTIEPNEGIVSVPDDRLGRISKYIVPKKLVPAGPEAGGHRRDRQGGQRGPGAGQQVPQPHPRGRRDPPGRPLLRGPRRRPRRRRGRPGLRHRDDRDRADAGRHPDPRQRPAQGRADRQGRRQGGQAPRRGDPEVPRPPGHRPAAPQARARRVRGQGDRQLRPDDRQAGPLRRQRRRVRPRRRGPAGRGRSASSPPRSGRRSSRSAPSSRPRSPSWTRPTGPRCSPPPAWPSRP